MKVEKYALKPERTLTIFKFICKASNGNIRKLIQFKETNEPELCNLAVGIKFYSTWR